MRTPTLCLAISISLLAACKDTSSPCDRAMVHATKVAKADMPPGAPDSAKEQMDKVLEQVQEKSTQHCNADAWSAEAIDCFAKAKTTADLRACNAKLTTAQLQQLSSDTTVPAH